MRTRMLQWLVLATGMVVLTGCAHNHLSATQVRPTPPPQPLIFYDETGNPSGDPAPLSELELREIIAWVATQTPDPIWLIRVKPRAGQRGRGTITAYIVPDEMTSRFRIGRAYYVPKAKEQTDFSSPWKYLQVSMPDHSFTEHFLKPSLPELPFEWPTIKDPNSGNLSPMSKAEALSIVDFVHQPSSYKEFMARDGVGAENMLREILESPVYYIRRRGNVIDAGFGFMHGVLWGNGLRVTVERTATGYKVRSWGGWVS